MDERDLIERIPTPGEVRDQLGRSLRELAILRKLLQLAELKERKLADSSQQAGDRQDG